MKRLVKIFMVIVFLLFAGEGYSQTAVQSGDTLRIRQQQREEQSGQQGEQQRAQDGSRQGQAAMANSPGQAIGSGQQKAVKQVRGSRPDMSKARGARPPMIVRPSGVPKGVGKPGGAGRKGGR